MKSTVLAGVAALAFCTFAHAQTAQETPPASAAAPAVEALSPPGTPSGESWNVVSRSTLRAYLAEVNGVTQTGGVSRVSLARVALEAPADDQSYSVDVFEFRCASKESRVTTLIQYGPDGAETDRSEDDSPWEAFREQSLDQYLSGLVCDGSRSANTYPSIKAFIDAGRP